MKRKPKFLGSSPVSPEGSTNQKTKRKRFVVPKKAESNKQNPEFLNSIPLPLTNKFASLEEKMDDDVPTSAHNASKTKVSPIVVTNAEINIQTIIASLGLTDQCEIKLVSVGRKIFTKSIEDKKKVIDALEIGKVDHFFHPDDEQKVFKAVLTGLPELPVADIENSLKTTHNITPLKVIMFNTKSSSKLYLCHFKKSEVNMKLLNTIKTCYHHIIKWQPYKPSRKGPTQCYRCMLYGHGISQCKRFAVCSLCSGNHLTNTCTVISKTTENPVYKCYNCASAGLTAHNHKATDPDCPYRAKYESAIKNARDKSKRTHQTNSIQANAPQSEPHNDNHYVCAPAPPPMSASYAHTARFSHTNTRPHTNTSSSRTQPNIAPDTQQSPTASEGNVWTISEVADLLLNSITELKACKTKLDQLKVIANLLQNACI